MLRTQMKKTEKSLSMPFAFLMFYDSTFAILMLFLFPVWEQELSAGASCQNMLVAATALGFASQWLTGWAAFSPAVMKGLGLGEGERIAGLMFFGNHGEEPTDRRRPVFDEQVSWGFPEGEAS